MAGDEHLPGGEQVPESGICREISHFTDHIRQCHCKVCAFATIHNEATLLLMDQLEEAGIAAMVGKVNMDRNSPDYLREASAKGKPAAEATKSISFRRWQRALHMAILTPRFIPSCSDELMELLHGIQKESGLPVQSHLSENQEEIAWVQRLPWSKFYGDTLRTFWHVWRSVPRSYALYFTLVKKKFSG